MFVALTFDVPTIVTVVTKDTSDDANGEELESEDVYLRVHRNDGQYAFHWSVDGVFWKLARLFALPSSSSAVTIGFIAQAPLGQACIVEFKEILTSPGVSINVRDGS